MNIRKMNIDDYEEVVDMFYSFITEVFSDKRKISPKYFYYKEVMSWINLNKDVIIAYKDSTIVGFSMCYLDEFNGLTERVYTCEYAYVKPEYRNSRAAYMLYNNAYSYGKEKGLNIVTNGRIQNGVSNMMAKHFDLKEQFINYEGISNG